VGKVEEILEEYCEGTATLTATAEAIKYGLANGLAVEEHVRGAIDRLVGDGRLAAQSAAKLLVMLAVPTPVEADGRTVFRASPETGRGQATPNKQPGTNSSTGNVSGTGGRPVTGGHSATGGHAGTSGSSAGWRKWAAEDITAGRVGVGTVLRDRFVIEEVVGEGGMGLVFRARDRRREEANDRNPFVAIKVLSDDFKTHPDALISLQREARRMQQLSHPNIASVYDFDRDGAHVYLVMELLEGEPLDRILERHANAGLPREQALRVIEAAGSALRHAHSRGLVHSDFKPANVFVTRSGDVKVIDFGIARIAKDSTQVGDAALTVFDAGRLGAWTNAYASPEQMLDGATPDARDDVYALGLVAYEALVGKHPFGRKSAVEARYRQMNVEPVPTLSEAQNAVLASALQFDRERRLADATQLAQGLAAPDQPEVHAPSPSGGARQATPNAARDAGASRKRIGLIVPLAVVGLAWLAFLLIYKSARQDAEVREPSAEKGAGKSPADLPAASPPEPARSPKSVSVAPVVQAPAAKPSSGQAPAVERPRASARAKTPTEPALAGPVDAAGESGALAAKKPARDAQGGNAPESAAATSKGDAEKPVLYRWVDKNGIVKFGEVPPAEYADSAVKLVEF
jgi:serine/threonine protein kinase